MTCNPDMKNIADIILMCMMGGMGIIALVGLAFGMRAIIRDL